MIVRRVVILGLAIGAGVVSVAGQGTGQGAAPAGPTITLGPGLNPVPDYREAKVDPPPANIPAGFTSIFNGKDLSGWHISKTARHGTTPDFHVAYGMILGTQSPLGRGGLLITDKKYRNFEFYMEANPDWGCDSGVFFRTTETGVAYQITMDYLAGGSMGRLISEGGFQVTRPGAAPAGAGGARGAAAGAAQAQAPAAGGAAPAAARGGQNTTRYGAGRGNPSNDPGMNLWKREEWNTVRVRVTGDAPHATVWINDQQVSDSSDSENHAFGGMIDGPIAIQIHGGPDRWNPGGYWRWRNLAIKELPN